MVSLSQIFTSLQTLNCNYNQLKSLDVKKNTALTTLYCNYNAIENISLNTQIVSLYLDNNQLTNLDLSEATNLYDLSCNYNQLSSLDTSNNTYLDSLYCEGNQIASLDVSKNTMLEYLGCNNNEIRELDVSANKILFYLDCNTNLLQNLDLRNNLTLEYLYCDYNFIDNLDVSKNTLLQYIMCGYNELTALDISSNTKLIGLYCNDNNLCSLDVSKNTELVYLECQVNALKNIDVSALSKLRSISCYKNQLSSLDLSKSDSLEYVYPSRQKRENLEYYTYNGSYIVNLLDVVGKDNTSKIIGVQGKSITDTNLVANYNSTTGIATFSSEPKEVTYIYKVKKKDNTFVRMDVSATLTKSDAVVDGQGHKLTKVVTKATVDKTGVVKYNCPICNKTISSTTIPKIASIALSTSIYTYNGQGKTPTVVVKDSKGNALKNKIDYTVSYIGDRKAVGKYTVKVAFKGNYSGTKNLQFTIKPSTTTISKLVGSTKKLTVKWSKKTSEVTGYQIQYSANAKFSKAKTLTMSKSVTEKTLSKLSAKKTYYVKIRTYKTVKVDGKAVNIYSDWSKIKSVKTK